MTDDGHARRVPHRLVMFLGDLAVALTPLIILLVAVDDPSALMYIMAAFGGMAAAFVWTNHRRENDD